MHSLMSDEGLEVIGKGRDEVQYLMSHFDAAQVRNMKEKWEVVHSSLYLESKTLLPSQSRAHAAS